MNRRGFLRFLGLAPVGILAAPAYAGPDPLLGTGYLLEAWPFQDQAGAAVRVPIQITRLNPEADRFEVEAEEMLFIAAASDASMVTFRATRGERIACDRTIANVRNQMRQRLSVLYERAYERARKEIEQINNRRALSDGGHSTFDVQNANAAIQQPRLTPTPREIT